MSEFICLGPKKGTDILLRFAEEFEKEMLVALSEALKNESHRLDDAFDHYSSIVLVSQDRPCVSLFVDADGRIVMGLSYLDPSESASVPYRIEVDTKPFSRVYESIFEDVPREVKSKIFQSPIRTPFISICGEKRLLGKLLLKEKLNAQRFFSYAELISDDVFEYLLKHHNTVQQHGKATFHIFCRGSSVYLTLLKDPDFPDELQGLIQAFAQRYKDELMKAFPNLFLQTEEFFRAPLEGKKLLTLRVSLEKLGSLYEKIPQFLGNLRNSLHEILNVVDERMKECLEKSRDLLGDF